MQKRIFQNNVPLILSFNLNYVYLSTHFWCLETKADNIIANENF